MIVQLIVLRTDAPTWPHVVYRYQINSVRHVVRGKSRDAEAAIEQHLRSVPDGPHQIEYRDAPCLQYIEPSWDADLIGR